jgi:hypothetical protein
MGDESGANTLGTQPQRKRYTVRARRIIKLLKSGTMEKFNSAWLCRWRMRAKSEYYTPAQRRLQGEFETRGLDDLARESAVVLRTIRGSTAGAISYWLSMANCSKGEGLRAIMVCARRLRFEPHASPGIAWKNANGLDDYPQH